MPRREKTLSSRKVYQGRAVTVRVDEVEMPSGRRTTREVVEHPDAVVVVPLDGEGGVYLVRQFRQAVGKHLLELPAGGLEPGEAPEACVARELREELGMRPGKVERVGGFYSAPGFCTEYLHLFLARDLHPDRLPAEDAEVIDVVHVSLKEVPRLIASGEIQDAKSIAGLFLVLSRGRVKEERMGPKEFARQLNHLQREIFRAILSYQVRLALWPTPKAVDTLNRYCGFFQPVGDALYVTMVMGFAKVFDGDSRTMSLKNLMKIAKDNVADLVPNMTREDIEGLEHRVSRHNAVLKGIERLRNQHLAHLDANPKPSLSLVKKDFDQMITTLKQVFNQLSKGHGKPGYIWWSHQAGRSKRQTTQILHILKDDAKMREAQADAAMKASRSGEP